MAVTKRWDYCPYDSDDPACWESPTSYAIRYAIVIAVVAALLIYVFVGMWHAHRRVRAGKEPMFYHRWLVPTRTLNRLRGHDPSAGQGYYPPNNNGGAYPMGDYVGQYAPPPPPVYSADAPPKYQAPDGPPPNAGEKGGAAASTVAVGESSSSAVGAPQAPPPAHRPVDRS